MAGDWLKIEVTLPKKPEVWQIAGVLGTSPEEVVGRLIKVWAWFDAHTEKGHAPGVTFVLVDAEAGVTGFAEAMSLVGWLEQKDRTLVLPNFNRHNGKTAKNRALSRDRKAASRANVPENVPEMSRSERDKNGPREEKRREEEDKELPPDGGGEVGKPTPPPADLAKRQQERLREVTEDARLAFNATLAKPAGLLPSVRLLTEVRMREVKRCLSVARLICQEQYGSERITPQFWADYFAVAAADDFHAGRVPGGPGHEGWQPDFEYLTRPAVMAKLFDRALADEPQAGVA